MSQLVRIQTKVFHVPSIARLRLTDTTLLGRPMIVIQDHAANVTRITYGVYNWKNAEADYNRLQHSVMVCRDALKHIPSIDETSQEKKELV